MEVDGPHCQQAPCALCCWLMPAGGTHPPDWEAFVKVFAILRVNPVHPGFHEHWHYILAWAYHKCCLDAAHKWKITGTLSAEVRWVGRGKLPLKERTVNDMWAAVLQAAEEAGL